MHSRKLILVLLLVSGVVGIGLWVKDRLVHTKPALMVANDPVTSTKLISDLELLPIPGRSFKMMKNTVTFELWDTCVGSGGCDHYSPADSGWGRGKKPVTYVSYDDAVIFAQWISAQTGKNLRLPTEEEWEYAARGGGNTDYPWGNTIHCELARYGRRPGGECGDTLEGPAPVGSYPSNAYGLFDMSGNVWQWTSTCFDAKCKQRVLRGGSWLDNPAYLRISFRGGNKASSELAAYGFRLVMDN